MGRLTECWPRIVAFENLLLAFRKARRGKRDQVGVMRFALNLERELFALQRELDSNAYRPGGYRLFTIYERKPRVIAAAPFRDRVVHHALMNVIEAPIDRTFIYDSYASRRGKGVHAAVGRYQQWARRYPYAIKLDVVRYFPSIDHALLKEALRRRIADKRALALIDRIIDDSPPGVPARGYFPGDDLLTPLERRTGLPIGNLTSQFFANLYLDALDHYVKEKLRCKAYLRYVDDLIALGEDAGRLRELQSAVSDFLESLRLRLHDNRGHVTPTRVGLDVLGYRVFPHARRLRKDNGVRFQRRLKRFARAFAAGRMDWREIDASVQAWLGHARHGDTRALRKAIFSATIFSRGSGH